MVVVIISGVRRTIPPSLLVSLLPEMITLFLHPEHIQQNLPCLYHEAHFSPSSAYFVLECLGPGVPTASLYRTLLPEPRLMLHLENNTAVKVTLKMQKNSSVLMCPRFFKQMYNLGR